MAAVAEGVGMRAVARVLEADANPVRRWLVEAAEPLHAVSRHWLPEVHVAPV
jgi:hypothetical protein